MREDLFDFFASVDQSMISLFTTISGGVDWVDTMRALNHVDPFYGYIFLVYIALALYGVLNVVTAVFVESAMETSKSDRVLTAQEDMHMKKQYISRMRSILSAADTDGSGNITWAEFKNNLEDPKLQAYFTMWGLEASEAANIFRVLDEDCVGHVSIDSFITGCFHFRGIAKQLD